MRLSHFTSQNCLIGSFSKDSPEEILFIDDLFETPRTINEFARIVEVASTECDETFTERMKDEQENMVFELILQGFDVNCKLIYDTYQYADCEMLAETIRQPRAFRMPQKSKALNISNDMSTMLQYIISPDDFKNDQRNFNNISTAVSDLKYTKSLYSNLIERYKKDSFVVNFMLNIEKTQKYNSKPLILLKNPNNNFNKCVAILLKHRSTYNDRLKINHKINPLFIKNDTDKIELSDNNKYVLKKFEQENVVKPLILGDLGLLYTFISVETKMDEEETKDLMLTIPYIENKFVGKYSIEEYLNTMTDYYLSGFHIDQHLQQVLCILTTHLLNDSRAINYYLENNLNYSYKYYPETPVLGYTTVEFTYLGENFRGVFKEKKKGEKKDIGKYNNIPKLYFETNKLQLLPGAYLLLKRLSGQISLNKFLANNLNATIKEIPFIELDEECTETQIYGSIKTNTFTLLPNPRMDFPLPCFKVDHLLLKMESKNKMFLERKYNYDFNKHTMFANNAKLFTIPYFRLKQMDMLKEHRPIFLKNCKVKVNFLLHEGRLEKLIKGNYNMLYKDFFENIKTTARSKLLFTQKDIVDKLILMDETLEEKIEATVANIPEVTINTFGSTLTKLAFKIETLTDSELLDKKDLEEKENKIFPKKISSEQEEKVSKDIQDTGLLSVSADTTTKRNISEMVDTLHNKEKELSTIPRGFNLQSNFENTIDKSLPFTLNLVKKNMNNMFQRMCLSCLSGLPGIRNIDVSTVHALLFKVTDDRYCKDLTKPSYLFLNEIYNYMIKNYTPTREEYQISKKLSVKTKKRSN